MSDPRLDSPLPSLAVRNLTATHPGAVVPCLRDVSFSLAPGERIAVVGASGAGKSSLIETICGILPFRGEIAVEGLAVTPKTVGVVRKKLGVCFQNPDDQLLLPTVREDTAFGGDTATADALCRAMGIAHLADRMCHTLSGGEKRMVALCGAMVKSPALLLLDEPSSFLDPRARRRLSAQLQSLTPAMLVATHDLDFAEALCPRTLLLRRGEVFCDGATADVLHNAELLNAAEM